MTIVQGGGGTLFQGGGGTLIQGGIKETLMQGGLNKLQGIRFQGSYGQSSCRAV